MTDNDEALPEKIRSALQEGEAAAIASALELVGQDPDHGLLALYALAANEASPEYARVLAVQSLHRTGSVAEACQWWLLEERGADLGVALTGLTILHTSVLGEARWKRGFGGVLPAFILGCIGHQEIAVRVAAIELLADASKRSLAPPLPSLLGQHLSSLIDATSEHLELFEQEEANKAKSWLLAEAPTIPIDVRHVQRVALDILDVRDKFGPMGDRLAAVAGRRAMLDDALDKAACYARPIQTLRVRSDSAPTSLFRSLLGFAESVARAMDSGNETAMVPDFGTSMAWSPAASVPVHVIFDDATATKVFDALQTLMRPIGLERPGQDDLASLTFLNAHIADALLGLLQQVQAHNTPVEIILTQPSVADWQRTLVLDPSVLSDTLIRSLAQRARSSAHQRAVRVAREDVPQANSVAQVFETVDAMLARGEVTMEDISGIGSTRQVSYYKQAARTLGLFDADNRPTSRARALIGRTLGERLALTAVFFEDCAVGRGWCQWSGKDSIVDVDPSSAAAFISECAPELTGSTPERRSSTLRRWHGELVPHHPASRATLAGDRPRSDE